MTWSMRAHFLVLRKSLFSSPDPVVSWSRGYKLSRVALGTRMENLVPAVVLALESKLSETSATMGFGGRRL